MANIQIDKTPIQRLLEIIQLERQDIALLVALTLGYGILGIATPVAVQALVNIVTMGGLLKPLYVISIMLFVLLILSGILFLFEAYIVELIQRRLFVRFALQSGTSVQGMQLQTYDANNPVELVNRFLDVKTVQKSASTLLTVALAAVLQGIVGSFVLMFYSIYFIAVVLLIIVVLLVIVFLIGRMALPTALEESNVKYETIAWIETIARESYLFRFFNAKKRVELITDQHARNFLDRRKDHFSVLFMQNLAAIVLYAVAGTLMLVLGGSLVIQGQINVGQFVAAELIIFGVLSSFVTLTNKLEAYYDLLVALDKLGAIQDLPQEALGTHLPENGHYSFLEATDLTFAFSERVVPIQGLSFKLKKGQSLSILGTSGVGKTTLVELLTGLRTPSKGYIATEGIDFRQLNLSDFRDHIGLATKLEFIEDTILNNLMLNRDEVTIDEVHQLLSALNLDKDVAKLDLGLDTLVTAFGAPLSTTQGQRMMLVRALVGKPDFVVIDGLLDNLNQDELTSVLTLLKQMASRWMLVVTTRREDIASQFDQTITLGQRVREQS
ncbi:MAG: ABC transporter ATP-binding protein [Methylophilus sp.]|nr:ABC transporter ATP-binding protein [Methylophilus sp.]